MKNSKFSGSVTYVIFADYHNTYDLIFGVPFSVYN